MKYMYIFWFRPCCHQADRPVGNVTWAHGCWCQWCQWWPCCPPAAPPPPSSSSPTSSELYPGLREVHCSSLVIAIDGNDNQISWWKRKIMMAMIWCICWPTLCVLRLVSAQDDLAVKATTLFFAEGSLIRMNMLSETLPSPSWVIFDITIMSDDLKGFPLKTQNLAAIVSFHLLQHPVYNVILKAKNKLLKFVSQWTVQKAHV